jgi:hypothetical protein
MKSFFDNAAKFIAALSLAAAFIVGAGARVAAQVTGRLQLDSLERLAPKSIETVNIEIDGILIKLAGVALDEKDPDEKNVKELISGLRGVYVKSYEFKTDGEFGEGDLSPIREQLRAPGWTRMVDVKSRGVDIGDAEIYVATEAGRVEGMAILVVDPKELTVINIVGSMDIDKLKKLEGNLGIPRIHIQRKGGRRASRR